MHSLQAPGSETRAGPVSRPQDGAGWPYAASWRTRSQEPESAARIPCARDARPHGGARGSDGGRPAHSPRSRRRIGPPTRAGPVISALPGTGHYAAAAPEESGAILSRGNNSRSRGLLLPLLPGWRGTLWPHPGHAPPHNHALCSTTPTTPPPWRLLPLPMRLAAGHFSVQLLRTFPAFPRETLDGKGR